MGPQEPQVQATMAGMADQGFGALFAIERGLKEGDKYGRA
jgi:hypothetical protein